MIKYLFQPAYLLKSKPDLIMSLSGLMISGIAFSLFFLQTGLDRNIGMYQFIMYGFLFGTIGIALAGFMIWLLSQLMGNDQDILAVISAISFSYTTTLVFVSVGIALYYTLGWRTALSCGITGVLAALGPMTGIISQITQGKRLLDILIITLVGIYVLLCWYMVIKLI